MDEPTSVRKFRVAPRASYAPLDRLPGRFRAGRSGWPKAQFGSTMGSFCMIGIGAPLELGPAARSYRQKGEILAHFKGNNTRRSLFFSACVGMVLANNISARKISRREVGGPVQRLLQAAVEQLTGKHSTPTLDFFRAISARECLVVSIVTRLCGAKLNSLTPLGSVGLPLLKVTM